ncbi:MAG: LytTR family DNA-binding domain-containing protein [Bacteroidota bacterium]
MLTAVLIDDEKHPRVYLAGHLAIHCPEVKVVGEADGVEAGLALLQEKRPDIAFLDIQMQDGTGFDLLEKWMDVLGGSSQISTNVIFTTAFDEFALKAIKFSAVDYLLKPIEETELQQAVAKVRHRKADQDRALNYEVLYENFREMNLARKKIALSTVEKTYVVRVQDIIRCESDDSYTRFYIRDRKPILTSKSLRETEEMLAGCGFERVHKSHLVNLEHLVSYEKQDGGYLLMEDGGLIPISRRKKDRVLAMLKNL